MTISRIGWSVVLVLVSALAQAEGRRVIQYEYDGAGNVISIDTSVSLEAPAAIGLSPDAIRIGQSLQFTLTGSDLANAQVTTDDSDLVSRVIDSTQDTLVFRLTANEGAQLGAHTLTFQTSLGVTTADIQVLPELPVLGAGPLPLVVSEGGSVTLDISISSIDITDHDIALIVGDESIATLSSNSLNIAEGQTRPAQQITVTGLARGKTALQLQSATLGNLNMTIAVSGTVADFPEGTQVETQSAQLGIELTPVLDNPDLAEIGPVISSLGVLFAQADDQPDANTPAQINNLTSQQLQVAVGPFVSSVSPRGVAAGVGAVEVEISGQGLDQVTDIEIVPDTGVVFGALSLAPDGSRLTLPVSVAEGEALSNRRLVLSRLQGAIASIPTSATQLFIGGGVPDVESIDPVVASRLSTFDLTVLGSGLEGTTGLTVVPSDGVTLGSQLTVSDDGSQVSVPVSVSESAPLGERTIVVNGVSGDSSVQSSPANTLEIVNATGEDVDLASTRLGVVFGEESAAQEQTFELRNTPLSVVFGASLLSLSPTQAVVGSRFDLTLQGLGLENVTGLTFTPSEGVEVISVVPGANGQSVNAEISLSSDAPTNIREVNLIADTGVVPTVNPAANRFLITLPQPTIDSITPNVLVAGAAPTELLVRGNLLDGVQAINVLPANGVLVSGATVNSAGTEVRATISAADAAQLGPRSIIVETVGGASDADLQAANTLNVVAAIEGIKTPLLAPVLGVVVEPEGGANADVIEQQFSVTAAQLGVEIETEAEAIEQEFSLVSGLLGVNLGAVATGISQPNLAIGSQQTLTVFGAGLDAVTAVQIVPDQGLVVPDVSLANAEGTELSFPLIVETDAAQTERQVILQTADGRIPFTSAAAGVIQITNVVATIESIEPIQQVPGSSFEMIIRGQDLEATTAVSIEPQDGIFFNTPVVSADGSEVRVQVVILPGTSAGPRAVTVQTPAGSTTAALLPANTFTVVDNSLIQ